MTWSAVFFPLVLGAISGLLFARSIRFLHQARRTLAAADEIHAAAMREFSHWQQLRMEAERVIGVTLHALDALDQADKN